VVLPYALERRAVSGKARAPKLSADNPGQGNPMVQQMNLRRLDRKMETIAQSIAPKTVWGNYTKSCSYDQKAESSKKGIVGEFLRQVSPASVLDVGCNTGDYSRIAAESGAQVIATDFDIGAVEQMYQQLQNHPADIAPMVVDIANPSPGIGFMNGERTSFLERASPDCVLALAVMHHLLVGANLSLEAIRDLFATLSNKHLVLEFVPTSDIMFRKLVEFRVDLFGHVTLDRCLEVFREKFVLLRQEPVRNSPRTLLLFQKA
jgi:SAM-dependent methyltransferase